METTNTCPNPGRECFGERGRLLGRRLWYPHRVDDNLPLRHNNGRPGPCCFNIFFKKRGGMDSCIVHPLVVFAATLTTTFFALGSSFSVASTLARFLWLPSDGLSVTTRFLPTSCAFVLSPQIGAGEMNLRRFVGGVSSTWLPFPSIMTAEAESPGGTGFFLGRPILCSDQDVPDEWL